MNNKPGSYGYNGGVTNDDYDSDCAGYDSYGANDDGEDKYRSSDEDGSKDGSESGMPGQRGNKKSNKPSSLDIWRKEADVGITEFCGAHEGFFAIIKQRYKDFHVNEINVQGEVIHLTDESVPDQPKEKEHIVPDGAPACITEENISDMDHMFGIQNKLSEDIVMAEKGKNAEKMVHEVLIKVEGLEKEERTSIHLFIKNNYKKVLTSVKEINKEKYIQVRRGIADEKWNMKIPWPKLQRYTHFVLYKENMDTIEAIKKLSERTRAKPEMYSYADHKDKRAKASQLVSVLEVRPQRLYSVTKDNWAIKVGNFSFHENPIRLGQLSGNRYRLVLRKITAPDEVVNKAVESLKTHGFINYYGMHRFGTTDFSPLNIGKMLMKGNNSEIIKLILTPSSVFYGENYFVNLALKEYNDSGNAKEALAKLNECNKSDSLEAKILTGLSECDKDDSVGVLNHIPRNIRSQYMHAYQSFIWNSIASRRIKEFGLRVLPGDLVRRHPSNISKEKIMENTYETLLAEDSTTTMDMTQEKKGDKVSVKKDNVDIHRLTAEEANNTKITDILLPLPGHDIMLPENEIKDWYVEMLKKDGLSLDKLKDEVKNYTLNGIYHHLLIRPSDVSHSITYYNDVDKPLVQSDKEKLKGEDVEKNKLDKMPEPMEVDKKEKIEDEKAVGGYGGYGGYGAMLPFPKIDPTKGKMKALILEMTLPPSCYPSMALRELLKTDSSSQYQNILDPAIANMKLGRGRRNFGRRGRRGRRGRS